MAHSFLSRTTFLLTNTLNNHLQRHGFPVSACGKILNSQIRPFSIHEYMAMGILKESNICVPAYDVARTTEGARKIAANFASTTGVKDVVVKAQILAGGRGKGEFDSGLKGGVKIVYDEDECATTADKMLQHKIVTKQTGPAGRLCKEVLVCERLYSRKECYFAVVLDRESACPVLLACADGGVNIEELAVENPEAILRVKIDPSSGISSSHADQVAEFLNFSGAAQRKVLSETVERLYNVFVKYDCTLLEINPIAEDSKGEVYCMDCKMNFDDNAFFRQEKIWGFKDLSQEDERDARAQEVGINYIGLDGTIGCLVNGAGLAMATMDIIKLHGGSPANFLDVGGGATAEQVTQAFDLITSDANVHAILVNIFGGIMRCDVIAQGIVTAAKLMKRRIPIIVRLQGTRVDEAKGIIASSDLKILPYDDLDEAANMVVKLANIVELAKVANVQVKFELPL